MMERCMECIGIDDVENIPPSRMPANMGSADDIGRPSWLPLDVPPSTPAPCRCSPCSCIRLLCSPMFGVVFFIVGISYAPYVLWVPWKYFALKCFCLSVFHVLIALLIGSYVMCVFTDPGTVPLSWQRIVEADPDLANDHVICRKSGLYRPLRSHFCSVTRRVVLNMDHFCPWVVNTVGFYNRKFFVLFLGYTFLSTAWVLLTSLPFLYETYQRPGGFRVLERQLGSSRYAIASMGTIVDAALLVMLSCFFPFHLKMTFYNETTIEGSSPEFHAGVKRNMRQIYGRDERFWFIPIWASGPDGDGIHWPSPLVRRPLQVASSPPQRVATATSMEEGRLLRAGTEDDSSGDEEE